MQFIRFFYFLSISIFTASLYGMDSTAKIYVAGHAGLVGSAVVEALYNQGYTRIVTRTSQELDLRNQNAVYQFFNIEKPDYVFLAAAHVGGIKANDLFPADFTYDNLMIEANVIHAAYVHGVKKLLFLGSSCIYPRICPQPIKEEYLLTGSLEETNKGYAIAKIAGLVLCQAYNKQYATRFISCMPTNLYGPGDNFHPEYSHVIPGLIHKLHRAKINNYPSITIWGTGKARREFLFIKDLAEALIFLMNRYEKSEPINIGTGTDHSIEELVIILKNIIGYEGIIHFDGNTYYDGTPQKLLSVEQLTTIGWTAHSSLYNGLCSTYEWYLSHTNNI